MTTTVPTEPASDPNYVAAADLKPGQWAFWPDSGEQVEILSAHRGPNTALVVYRSPSTGAPESGRVAADELVQLLTDEERQAGRRLAARLSIAEQFHAVGDLIADLDLPVGTQSYDVIRLMVDLQDAEQVDQVGELLEISPTTDTVGRYEVSWSPRHLVVDDGPRVQIDWYVYLPNFKKTPKPAPAAAAELPPVAVAPDDAGFFFTEPDRMETPDGPAPAHDVQGVAVGGRVNGKAAKQ